MYYAISSPRRFANETSAYAFATKASRDAFIDEVDDNRRYQCTRKQAYAQAAANRQAARDHEANSAYPPNFGALDVPEYPIG